MGKSYFKYRYEPRPKSAVCEVQDRDRDYYVMWAKFNTIMDNQEDSVLFYLAKELDISLSELCQFRRGYSVTANSERNFSSLSRLLDLISKGYRGGLEKFRHIPYDYLDSLTFVDWRKKISL